MNSKPFIKIIDGVLLKEQIIIISKNTNMRIKLLYIRVIAL